MNEELWCWGSNSHGQLGVKDFNSEESSVPIKSPIPGSSMILDVALGGGHTLISCHEGHLYGSGRNDQGQLALGCESPSKVSSWTLIPRKLISNDIRISAGWDFSYFYSCNEIGVAGSNAFGQIALNKGVKRSSGVTVISHYDFVKEGIKDVACGLRHTLFLTCQGNVFGVGCNRKKQLGLEDLANIFLPTFVPMGLKVLQISTGQNFSLCLCENYKILGFGDDKFGQLQIPISVHDQIDPIVKIQCGWTHGVALSQHGRLMCWGRDTYGQTSGNDLENCTEVSSGSEHVIGLVNGELVSWGWNEHGNCGDGTTANVFKPSPIKFSNLSINGEDISLIRAGPGHSLAVLSAN